MDVSQFHVLPNACCSPSISQWKVHSRSRYQINLSLLDDATSNSSFRSVDPQLRFIARYNSRRTKRLFRIASADDGLTVDGTPQASTSGDIDEIRVNLDRSMQIGNSSSALAQSVHETARVIELTIKSQSSVSKLSWFPTHWLGVDRNAWVKTLSYQASVCSLLLAVCEISFRGDGRDKDINVFVHKSISRLCANLESVIKDLLSANQQLQLYEWFWSEQIPVAVSTFINYFEEQQRTNKGTTSSAEDASGRSLPIFALNCIAAITKVGPTKVCCPQLYSILPEISGGLMDLVVELNNIRKAYYSIKEIGLQREFLVHFGPRAAACRVEDDGGTEEVIFWVSLVQKQLQMAISRERIWSRLALSETIEVLDKDLAIFGFFIALGRRTQWFLGAKNFETVPEPIEGLIRHLISGSVLYYPQLSSISSYQLYVEVVCEELDWLPFYPGVANIKQSQGHKSQKGPPSVEAIPIALDVCLHWIQSFIRYSKWLEDPSNVKASRFLSRGHDILKRSMDELGLPKKLMIENTATNFVEITDSGSYASSRNDIDSFDKALESVDEALLRLEKLLKKRHVSSSNSGKEHLKAACSDLEKIRKLKKEAEFLEASFQAKADSLKQDNTRVSEGKEIQRFELIRNELKKLESQVERNDKRSNNIEEEVNIVDEPANYLNDSKGIQLVKVQNKENIIEKYFNKLKKSTTDVLQGTQLLAIDVGAATGLVIRAITGDKLMQKEKQALRRTLTDMASVVPIGFLMLLPVTAVGHAAMLAAIQRYVPSLIPSTYGPERLDLLRQLKKVKEMDTTDVDPTDESLPR